MPGCGTDLTAYSGGIRGFLGEDLSAGEHCRGNVASFVDLGDHDGYEVKHNCNRNRVEGDLMDFDEWSPEIPHGLVGRLVDEIESTRLDEGGVHAGN